MSIGNFDGLVQSAEKGEIIAQAKMDGWYDEQLAVWYRVSDETTVMVTYALDGEAVTAQIVGTRTVLVNV